MASGGWVQLLNYDNPEQPPALGAQNTFTTAKDLVNAKSLPAGALNLGSLLRFRAWGIYSTTGTPTLALSLYYGGAASGTALAATAATTTGSGVSNLFWELDATSVVTALTVNSSTGLTIATFGKVVGIGATASTPVLMPASSSTGNAVGSLNPTTANTLTVAAAWGTSSASNTINCYFFSAELLN